MNFLKRIHIIFLFSSLLCVQSLQAKNILAPELNAVNLAAEQIDLKDYRGKVVYLDFWASWCPPCAQSFPHINALYNELKSQGFEVIAVSLDQEKADMDHFLKKYPVDFIIGWDQQGVSPERFHVETMPTGYLIDKKGILRARFRGFHDGSEDKIKRKTLLLLSEKID